MLEQEGQPGDPGQRPGRQFEIMAIDLRRRLARSRARAGAVAAQGRHQPSAPPEDPIQVQTRVRERRAEGFREVAPAMALNGVELGEQLGQRRDADDQNAPGRTSIPSRATAARSSSRCSITSRASTASLAAAIWPRG